MRFSLLAALAFLTVFALRATAADVSTTGDAGEPHRQAVDDAMHDSDLIDSAKLIARDEGYDLTTGGPYEFEILDMQQPGYRAVGFDVNAHPANLILINISTGQAIDGNTCEVFDYPDLQPFQLRIRRMTKTTKLTAQQLADDIGCIGALARLLTKPVPIRKKK